MPGMTSGRRALGIGRSDVGLFQQERKEGSHSVMKTSLKIPLVTAWPVRGLSLTEQKGLFGLAY